MKPVLIWIGITLAGQIAGFSYWLGKLSQRVSNLSNDLPHIRQEISDLRQKMDDLHSRMSYLEGTIKRNQK